CGFRTKEITELYWHQDCDGTIKPSNKDASVPLTGEREFSGKCSCLIGIQREIDHQIIQCSLARKLEINRWTSVNFKQVCDDTIGWLRNLQIQIKLLVRIGKGCLECKTSTRTI